MHSYGEKEREYKVSGGMAELLLLLLWPPFPFLPGHLEVFQRALLYLIKASRAQGSPPRPAILLHFLETQARVQEEMLCIKKKRGKNAKSGAGI